MLLIGFMSITEKLTTRVIINKIVLGHKIGDPKDMEIWKTVTCDVQLNDDESVASSKVLMRFLCRKWILTMIFVEGKVLPLFQRTL